MSIQNNREKWRQVVLTWLRLRCVDGGNSGGRLYVVDSASPACLLLFDYDYNHHDNYYHNDGPNDKSGNRSFARATSNITVM